MRHAAELISVRRAQETQQIEVCYNVLYPQYGLKVQPQI